MHRSDNSLQMKTWRRYSFKSFKDEIFEMYSKSEWEDLWCITVGSILSVAMVKHNQT